MKSRRPLGTWFLIALLLAAASPVSAVVADELPASTALDRYIAQPDPSYSWKVLSSTTTKTLETIVIEMVSQTWRSKQEVDRPVWRHWLTVAIPRQRTRASGGKSDIGLLWIGSGSNRGKAPGGTSANVRVIAEQTGTVAAELRMVPNQPLVFHDDGQSRKEDDLIGYTWDQFLKTGDPTWPARNPMVKSAVRAMDTLSALTRLKIGGGQEVKRFVVAGGSKRGWTTWITGAVDRRVVAIIPIVIDVLNVDMSIRHHFAAYGFWAPSLGNYVEHRITERNNHPRMGALYKLVDPYFYRHRLTIPKFIVNSAGDQFFLPDSSRFYFAELRGQKDLRYVPNTDHSLRGSDAIQSIIAFYALVIAGKPTPGFSWAHKPGGVLELKTPQRPLEVKLWQATNPQARDFRLETLGPRYKSRVLKPDKSGKYTAKVSRPKSGFTAYFAELTFETGGPYPLKVTTDVRITPDILPYKDRDSSRPATVTMQAVAANPEVVAAIRTAIAGDRIGSLTQSMQVFEVPAETAPARVVRLNWTPRGRFRPSLEACVGLLRGLKCQEVRFWYESGPRREKKKK